MSKEFLEFARKNMGYDLHKWCLKSKYLVSSILKLSTILESNGKVTKLLSTSVDLCCAVLSPTAS